MVTVFTTPALLWTNKGCAPLLTTNYTTSPSETKPINTQVTKMHLAVRLMLVLKAQTFHLKC